MGFELFYPAVNLSERSPSKSLRKCTIYSFEKSQRNSEKIVFLS